MEAIEWLWIGSLEEDLVIYGKDPMIFMEKININYFSIKLNLKTSNKEILVIATSWLLLLLLLNGQKESKDYLLIKLQIQIVYTALHSTNKEYYVKSYWMIRYLAIKITENHVWPPVIKKKLGL